MSSNLKRKGGTCSGGDSWNPTQVLLHPSQIPYSHHTRSTRSSTPDGPVEPHRDDEDYGSELDYHHPAPHSIPNSRRASLNHSQKRPRSRPSTPPVDPGHGRDDGDYLSAYGIDFGGGPSLSSSSSSSSLRGLPGGSHKRLRRGRLRLNIRGLPSGGRRGLNIWRLLIRILCGLGLAWIVFGIVRIAASQVRIIYSHWVCAPYSSRYDDRWSLTRSRLYAPIFQLSFVLAKWAMQMNIPVELLDLCKDAEWTYHRPTLLTTDPLMETSPINQLHSASTFFEIPADGPLYLLSQGNFSYGTVEFLPATSQSAVPQGVDWGENGQGGVERTQEQKIRVEVEAKYRDPSIFSWARVCMIGGEGVEDETIPTSGAGGKTEKDSVLSQVGVMVWVSSTMSPPPSSLLIIFSLVDSRN